MPSPDAVAAIRELYGNLGNFEKDFSNMTDKEIEEYNILNFGQPDKANYERSMYKFWRQFLTNYYNSDRNKKLSKRFAQYKEYKNQGYDKLTRDRALDRMVNTEYRNSIETTEDGVTIVKVYPDVDLDLNLTDDEIEETAVSIQIEKALRDRLINEDGKSSNIASICELVENAGISCEISKIEEEMREGQLKYNALSLSKISEFTNDKLEEKVNEILGNKQNQKNRIMREATMAEIENVALLFSKAFKTVDEKSYMLKRYTEFLDDINNEKRIEITHVTNNGYNYTISKQEEFISSHPDLINIYPALKYKFFPDGTRRAPSEEVKYGIDKINNMIENADEINGNKDALDGKIRQVYDLINEDFIYEMSSTEDLDKSMRGFISSMGKESAVKYLNQLQAWQKEKEKLRDRDDLELENKIKSYDKFLISTKKEREDEDYKLLVETYKEALTRKIKESPVEIPVQIVWDRDNDNRFTINTEMPDLKDIETDKYIDNVDEYIMDDNEYGEYIQNEKTKKELRKIDASSLYKERVEKAKEKDPSVAVREEEFVKKAKRQSELNKRAEEKAQREEKNSKSTSKSTLKDNKATEENEKIAKEKEEDPSVLGRAEEFAEEAKKQSKINKKVKEKAPRKKINEYENGNNKDKNVIKENEQQLEIEGMPDGKIKNDPVDFSYYENKGKPQGKIEEPFNPISPEDQFTIEEYEDSKNSISKKRIQEYVGNKESIKKVTGINEHQVEAAKTKRQKSEFDKIKETKDPKAIASYIENNKELRKYLMDKDLLKYYKQDKEKLIEKISSNTLEQNKEKLAQEYEKLAKLDEKIREAEKTVKEAEDYVRYKRNLKNKEEDTPEI